VALRPRLSPGLPLSTVRKYVPAAGRHERTQKKPASESFAQPVSRFAPLEA